jgi:AmmeMemoRadiSam system protein B
MNLRKSVFSGSWYPSDRQACEDQIHQFLEEGKNQSVSVDRPVGGIVPHAGWYFSGSIACNVIHRLARIASPDVVVLFGMHLHAVHPAISCPRANGRPPLVRLRWTRPWPVN